MPDQQLRSADAQREFRFAKFLTPYGDRPLFGPPRHGAPAAIGLRGASMTGTRPQDTLVLGARATWRDVIDIRRKASVKLVEILGGRSVSR